MLPKTCSTRHQMTPQNAQQHSSATIAAVTTTTATYAATTTISTATRQPSPTITHNWATTTHHPTSPHPTPPHLGYAVVHIVLWRGPRDKISCHFHPTWPNPCFPIHLNARPHTFLHVVVQHRGFLPASFRIIVQPRIMLQRVVRERELPRK